jgi:hypothetical protein
MQKIAFAPRQDQPQCETLIVEDDIEEGAVHPEATVVVVQKAELPELIHEETDAGARGANHRTRPLQAACFRSRVRSQS